MTSFFNYPLIPFHFSIPWFQKKERMSASHKRKRDDSTSSSSSSSSSSNKTPKLDLPELPPPPSEEEVLPAPLKPARVPKPEQLQRFIQIKVYDGDVTPVPMRQYYIDAASVDPIILDYILEKTLKDYNRRKKYFGAFPTPTYQDHASLRMKNYKIPDASWLSNSISLAILHQWFDQIYLSLWLRGYVYLDAIEKFSTNPNIAPKFISVLTNYWRSQNTVIPKIMNTKFYSTCRTIEVTSPGFTITLVKEKDLPPKWISEAMIFLFHK